MLRRIRDKKFDFPDPTHELSNNFLGKKFLISLSIDSNFFYTFLKKPIIFNFVKFMATKKVTKCPARSEEKEVLDTSDSAAQLSRTAFRD